MKTIVYRRYGAPDVLELTEREKPTPKAGELLIRVRAVEATKSDCELRRFRFSVWWFWLPMRLLLGVRRPRRQVLGVYFAGEVEAVGADVTTFARGDRVFGATGLRRSAYAEYVALPQKLPLAKMPERMSFTEAAAVPLGGMNALHFMNLAAIQPGDAVLINGAGGAIGTHAVQIAKTRGAHVTAVDRGDKAEGLRRLGADEVIDYQQEDFTRRRERFDVLFDMVPGGSYGAKLATLKPRGRYLVGNPTLWTMLRASLTRRCTSRFASFAFAAESTDALVELARGIDAGEIGSIVDRAYPLEQAVAAHRQVESEKRVGAVVLRVGDGISDLPP